MTVHTILPPPLTQAVDDVLAAADVRHVPHGDADPVGAAVAAVSDSRARAVIGPYRSRAVAEVLEVTAPLGLPLLAPVATWVGVTRDDEPGGEDDPADHRGTVFRLVARDTVIAERIAQRVERAGQRALVVAGDHEYGDQVARQLVRAGLPAVDDPSAADVIVLAGLAGSPEIDQARALAPLSIIAFDGVQGEQFPRQTVTIAFAYRPTDEAPGVPEARRAAQLVVTAFAEGGDLLSRLRELGPFDAHGDLIDPDVWWTEIAATGET